MQLGVGTKTIRRYGQNPKNRIKTKIAFPSSGKGKKDGSIYIFNNCFTLSYL